MSKKWRWLLAAVVLAAVMGTWQARRVDACAFVLFWGSGTDICGPIGVAQQVTEIARLVEQLTELTSINEILSTDMSGVGNMGRLRELRDQDFWRRYLKNGLAQSTSLGAPEGLYSARVIGLSDEPGWLNILAAPRLGDPTAATVLLGGRPATETTVAEQSAFRTWSNPSGPTWSNPARNAARQEIRTLGDLAEGRTTWRSVWNDIEAALPNAIRPADVRALNLGADLETRIIEEWRRQERRAGADLQHAHAIAEAASTLQAQVGETAAHLGELRDDNLMGEERIDQAVLANGTTQTELLLALAQLLAQQQAQEARERYEAERQRREALVEWQAEMAQGQADWQTRRAGILAQRAARIAAHSRIPDPSIW